MSKSYRDQRRRPRSGKHQLCRGCEHCSAGPYKGMARRRERRAGKRQAREERES